MVGEVFLSDFTLHLGFDGLLIQGVLLRKSRAPLASFLFGPDLVVLPASGSGFDHLIHAFDGRLHHGQQAHPVLLVGKLAAKTN